MEKSNLKVSYRSANKRNDKQIGGQMFVLPDELLNDEKKAVKAMVETLNKLK